MLTSPQNSRIKLVRQLQQQNDAREREGLFVAEGLRLTDDFIRAGMESGFALIGESLSSQKWRRAHPEIDCIDVSDSVMRSVSVETTPPGVLVVFTIPTIDISTITHDPPDQILILDSMRDPGNMGACLRVAAGANCRLVLLSPGSVDPYNPKVVRGGMGAHARLRIASMPWDGIQTVCAGRTIWAADAGGEYHYDKVSWTQPNALIIGSEATGLSNEARESSTKIVTIPLANNVESLNAAVACGVILFESARQAREKTVSSPRLDS